MIIVTWVEVMLSPAFWSVVSFLLVALCLEASFSYVWVHSSDLQIRMLLSATPTTLELYAVMALGLVGAVVWSYHILLTTSTHRPVPCTVQKNRHFHVSRFICRCAVGISQEEHV